MELLHSHLTLLLFWGVFTSAGCQGSFWSNLIGRGVPEGIAGVDYPDYTSVPKRTAFTCRDRKPGFYADPETRCQAWHWCDTFLVKHSFLCANMTLFNQKIRGCDWWYNVDCGQAVSQYINNDELYRQDTPEDVEERDRERTRRNRKQGHPPVATPVSNDLGAEQSINGFTVTNAVSQPPEADLDFGRSQTPAVSLDFDESLHFSASSAAPFTEAPFFDTSATNRLVPTSSPSTTRGVSLQQPTTRVPTKVRQIFVRPNTGGFQINIANAIPIVFPPPPPKVLPLSTTIATTRDAPDDTSATLAANVAFTEGFDIQKSPPTFAISKEKPLTIGVAPSNGLTKPRRRLRFRTHPTTRVSPTALPAFPFNSQPSVAPSVGNPVQPATTANRVAPTALPAFPFAGQQSVAPPNNHPVQLSTTAARVASAALPIAPFNSQTSAAPSRGTPFQPAIATTRVAPAPLPAFHFNSQPSAVPPSSQAVPLPTTATRVVPTALPAFPFAGQPFAAPPGSSPVRLDNFFAPNAATPPPPLRTTTTVAPSMVQAQTFSRFPEFPPFPRTSSISATLRPFFAPSTTEGTERPTVPFNFGIPFGARIGPSEVLEQAATVRRSDAILPDPTTGGATALQQDTTVTALRKRKFVDIGKTFPPFSMSTSQWSKFTKVANPSTQLVVDLSTSSATVDEDRSATVAVEERQTPKPTKRRRKISTSRIQWSSTTDVPVTTFRPPRETDVTAEVTSGALGGQALSDSTTAAAATDAVALQDDISLV